MNMPPAILDLKIDPAEGRPHHLWLPLFLLWPLVLLFWVVSLLMTIIADVVLLLLGRRYHHYTILVARSFAALAETRGMVVRFSDSKTTVDMTVL
jgi:hypothetical protein